MNYTQSIARLLPLILLVSFVLAATAYLIATRIGPTHQVHFSYLISLSERESADDFRFDGYYAIQATDLFAATVAQWATTPEVVVAAYQAADLKLPTTDPRQLVRQIEAQKTAPQLVQITVKNKKQETAEQLAQGLITVMQKNVELYHDEGIPTLTYRVVATQPWTGTRQVATLVITIATFLAAFIITLNTSLLFASLKET